MTRSTAQILHAAADLLEGEGEPAWTQGQYARTTNGNTAAPSPNGAWFGDDTGLPAGERTCWCALGAIAEVCHIGEGQFDGHPAVQALLSNIGGTTAADIASWNDLNDTTQDEVVGAFREAAEWSGIDERDDRTNGQMKGPDAAR